MRRVVATAVALASLLACGARERAPAVTAPTVAGAAVVSQPELTPPTRPPRARTDVPPDVGPDPCPPPARGATPASLSAGAQHQWSQRPQPLAGAVILAIDQEEQQLRVLPAGAPSRAPVLFSLAQHYYDLEVIAFRQCVTLHGTDASAKAAAQPTNPFVRDDIIGSARVAAQTYCRTLEQEAPAYAATRFCPTS